MRNLARYGGIQIHNILQYYMYTQHGIQNQEQKMAVGLHRPYRATASTTMCSLQCLSVYLILHLSAPCPRFLQFCPDLTSVAGNYTWAEADVGTETCWHWNLSSGFKPSRSCLLNQKTTAAPHTQHLHVWVGYCFTRTWETCSLCDRCNLNNLVIFLLKEHIT